MYECGNIYTWATFTSDVTSFTQNGYPTAVSIRRGDVLDGFAKHIPGALIMLNLKVFKFGLTDLVAVLCLRTAECRGSSMVGRVEG